MTINMEISATKDAMALSVVHCACFAAGWSSEAISSMLAIKGTVAFIMDDGTGFAIVRCLEGEAEILTLGVLPQMRGQGIGHALVNAMQAHAILKEGATTMFLEARRDNVAALTLYKKHGFSEVSVRKDYYRNPDGSYEDAVVMRAKLPRVTQS